MRITKPKAVLEVIGRLQGRANHHENAGNQTKNEGKRDAHHLAASDMRDLANILAEAFEKPELAIV